MLKLVEMSIVENEFSKNVVVSLVSIQIFPSYFFFSLCHKNANLTKWKCTAKLATTFCGDMGFSAVQESPTWSLRKATAFELSSLLTAPLKNQVSRLFSSQV